MNSHYEKFFATGEVKCIDDEIPFEIPTTWEWCRVANIVQINPKNNVDDDINAAFIPMEMIDATYLSSFTYTIRKWREIKVGFTHFADGDVAFAKITPCFQNRKSMILKGLPKGIGAGTTELKVLRTYRNTISTKYLLFFLESPYFVEEATFKGTANQQRIISGYLENKLFPLPPLNEQRRIVEKIENAFIFANEYGKAQTKLDNLNSNLNDLLKKSILQEAIQGRLVPQIAEEGTAQELLEQIKLEKQKLVKEGKLKKSALQDSVIFKGDDNRYYEQIGTEITDITEEIPFEIPETWQWVRFAFIVSMTMGKTPPRGEQKYWSNGLYNWGSISDMVENGIIKTTKEKISEKAIEDYFKCTFSPIGSLLMSFKLTVGRTSILGIDAYHNEAIITVRPFFDRQNTLRDYLFHILPIIADKGDSKDAIKGKTLNSKSLSALLIPIPPLDEQRRIIDKINVIVSKVKA